MILVHTSHLHNISFASHFDSCTHCHYAPLSIHKVFTALQCGFGGAAHLMGNATKFVPGLIKPRVGGGRGQKPKSKAWIFMPIALIELSGQPDEDLRDVWPKLFRFWFCVSRLWHCHEDWKGRGRTNQSGSDAADSLNCTHPLIAGKKTISSWNKNDQHVHWGRQLGWVPMPDYCSDSI